MALILPCPILTFAQETLWNEVNDKIVTVYQQGRYSHRIKAAEEASKIAKKTVGTQHPEAVTSLNNLTELYRAQSRYGQAEPLYKRSLKLTQKAVGPNQSQGARKDEAEKLEVQAKKIRPHMRISIILVKTKPEAQKILQKLGAGADFAELARQYSIGPGKKEGGDVGYFAPGSMMEELNAVALNLKIGDYSGVVETSKGYFILMKADEKSPSELMVVQAQEALWQELNSKAAMLYQQGRYSEAAKVAQEALRVAENAFGPHHPNVATSLNALALLYHSQSKYAEAEPFYKRALGIVQKALGPDHPQVATVCENMAEIYKKIGKEDEAERLEARSRKIRSKR